MYTKRFIVDTHRGRSSVLSSSSSSSGFRVGEVAAVELLLVSGRAEASAGSACMATVGTVDAGMAPAVTGPMDAAAIMGELNVGLDQVGVVVCVGLHQVDTVCVGRVHVVVVCTDDVTVDNVCAGRVHVDTVELGRVHVTAADVGTA